MTNYFSAKPKLLAVLQSGGAREQIFTSKQVMNFSENITAVVDICNRLQINIIIESLLLLLEEAW